MKTRQIFLTSSLFLLLFFSCNQNLENNNLNNELKNIPNDSLFALKDLNTVSWDTMFVSKPYNYGFIKNKKINMPSSVARKFENISYKKDGYCVLIFVKDHTLVDYSVIPRVSVADFAFVDSLNLGLCPNVQFKIISDSISHRKVIMSVD